MAENFHIAGFVTVSITYPETELTARTSKLVDGKLAENMEGVMIFHQGLLGAYLRYNSHSILIVEAYLI